MELSIVIPVYNEEENVAPLYEEIESLFGRGLEHEVIFVDDGSDDSTPQRLAALQRYGRGPRVLRHIRNEGQSAALRTGIRAARFAWVATLDGDGQNDPADIALLLGTLRNAPEDPRQVELVCGIRARRRDPWLRRISSRIANRVRNAILHDGVTDTGCGLKLILRDAFLELPFFDHMHRFLPALFRARGGRVLTCEVSHRPRRKGRSKYGVHNRLWVGLVDLIGVWWLTRRIKSPRVEEIHSGVRPAGIVSSHEA